MLAIVIVVLSLSQSVWGGCAIEPVDGHVVINNSEWVGRGPHKFQQCSTLKTIQMPDNISTIENNDFQHSGLTEIEIPDSVITIESAAFGYCYDLVSVTLSSALESIGSSAFRSCNKLEGLSLPNTLTEVPNNFCYGCKALKSLQLSDSLTVIGIYAFASCESVLSIDLPNSLTTIGRSAFSNCDSILSVSVPPNVQLIGAEAFAGCDDLSSIEVLADNSTGYDDDIFDDCSCTDCSTAISTPICNCLNCTATNPGDDLEDSSATSVAVIAGSVAGGVVFLAIVAYIIYRSRTRGFTRVPSL